jgi:hypothetical protein
MGYSSSLVPATLVHLHGIVSAIVLSSAAGLAVVRHSDCHHHLQHQESWPSSTSIGHSYTLKTDAPCCCSWVNYYTVEKSSGMAENNLQKQLQYTFHSDQ